MIGNYRSKAITKNKADNPLYAMKKLIFACLVLLNLLALYYGATPFLVTFADVPMQMEVPLAKINHLHHKGMEDMRDFLLPSLAWLVGTMLMNFCVAGIAVFAKWRN